MLRKSTIIFVLLVLLASLATASVNAVNTGPLSKDAKPGNGGYIVTFNKEQGLSAGPSGVIMPMASSGSIRQGETQWRTRVISQYMTSFQMSLYWGNPSNSLRMRIYTPDGYTLGPYYDNYDGQMNGNIWVTISRSGGVAQGTYYMEIYGHRVNGVQSYTMN